jgi:hypothetical protein
VAALTVHAARAARAESRGLRVDAGELRLAVRRSLRVAAARKGRSRTATATATATAAQAQRAGPAASPWSSLEWLADDEELLRVLVPVD